MYDFRSIIGFGAQENELQDDNVFTYTNGIIDQLDIMEGQDKKYMDIENQYGRVTCFEHYNFSKEYFITIRQGMVKFSEDFIKNNEISSVIEILLYNFASPYIKSEREMEKIFKLHVNPNDVYYQYLNLQGNIQKLSKQNFTLLPQD